MDNVIDLEDARTRRLVKHLAAKALAAPVQQTFDPCEDPTVGHLDDGSVCVVLDDTGGLRMTRETARELGWALICAADEGDLAPSEP